MEWHERGPARWEAERRIGCRLLGDCRSGVGDGGMAFVEGVFHVRSRHGHLYDSVRLKVEYPANFPERGTTPTVVLLSHRDHWRKGGDSHINTDWSLCLFVPGESGIDFGKADSLNALFAVARTFLFKEYLYQQALANEELTGVKAVWPGKARSHGMAGIAEAVRDKGRVGRNEPCLCGSGKKFKVCCLRRLRR
jgi:SEC-C motif